MSHPLLLCFFTVPFIFNMFLLHCSLAHSLYLHQYPFLLPILLSNPSPQPFIVLPPDSLLSIVASLNPPLPHLYVFILMLSPFCSFILHLFGFVFDFLSLVLLLPLSFFLLTCQTRRWKNIWTYIVTGSSRGMGWIRTVAWAKAKPEGDTRRY